MSSDNDLIHQLRHLELFFDAGTRGGNPGQSGIAVYAETPYGPLEVTEFVGQRTNNEAEYLALLKALEIAVNFPELLHIDIYSDSKLVVHQARGQWRVRGNLKSFHARATQLAQQLVDRGCKVTIQHVRRAQNAEADRLVTDLLDAHLGKKRGY